MAQIVKLALLKQYAGQVLLAVLLGMMLHLVMGLQPIWYLAWVLPAIMLIWLCRLTTRQAIWLSALAMTIGASVDLPYFQSIMSLPFALLVCLAFIVQWCLPFLFARHLILRYRAWWCAFVYPLSWVALDTLKAHLLADGNWGSFAYTQADILPLIQINALLGVPGLLFLLSWLPSAVAVASQPGFATRSRLLMVVPPLLALAASLLYGEQRLQQTTAGQSMRFGLVAIDDAIGPHATPRYISSIWQHYDEQIAKLAEQGAQVIVLPEKIQVFKQAEVATIQTHLSQLAQQQHVWLEVGVGVDDAGQRRNLAWLFAPDGALASDYQKHHMAPPEREFIAGQAYNQVQINGQTMGLAICKDMHFASMGRAYGARQTAVMLIPAWDFGADGWLAERMTAIRGVESGFAVVRAAREGKLSISDAYGRILAQTDSASRPGATLIGTLNLAPPIATLYTLIGDALGWLCVALAAILLGWSLLDKWKPGRNQVGASVYRQL